MAALQNCNGGKLLSKPRLRFHDVAAMTSPVRSAIAILPCLLVLLAMLVSLPSCASREKPSTTQPSDGGGNGVAGIWKHQDGALLALRADGAYGLDANRDAVAESTGVYRVNEGQITISYTGGETPGGCEWPGVYRFERNKDRLRFTMVEDACSERVKLLTAAFWQRQ